MWKMIFYSLLAVFVTLMIFIPVLASSQEIAGVFPEGVCGDFALTVTTANITEGCWDVKIDVPGRIQRGNGDWTSTFYYVDQAICYPGDQVTLKIDLESTDPLVRGTAKIRHGNKIIEKDFTIRQSCPPPPEPIPDMMVIIITLGVVILFSWLITWWWKQGKH